MANTSGCRARCFDSTVGGFVVMTVRVVLLLPRVVLAPERLVPAGSKKSVSHT